MSIEVFFSYSHRDEDARDQLEKHLARLKRAGHITSWHDRKITAGQKWVNQIDRHLSTAHVILLLISADFLASDYCYGIEMTKALERHDKGEACVIPIILHACDWNSEPLNHLQCLPKDARPISSWPNVHEAYADVATGIRKAIEELSTSVSIEATVSSHPATLVQLSQPISKEPLVQEKTAPGGGICHVRDEVDISYSDDTKSYHVLFRKVIRNLSTRPKDHIYARIDVCVTPGDQQLAQAYYHDHPISLEGLNFRATDGEGHPLDVHILHQYPSNIEMHLRFRDRVSGAFFPIYENQEIEIRYECDVSDRQWGTYLRRHVRVKTDHLAVRFSFPSNLARVWGNEEMGDNMIPLPREIVRQTMSDKDIYTWSTSTPDLDTIFTFHWAFTDGREKSLYEELRRSYGSSHRP